MIAARDSARVRLQRSIGFGRMSVNRRVGETAVNTGQVEGIMKRLLVSFGVLVAITTSSAAAGVQEFLGRWVNTDQQGGLILAIDVLLPDPADPTTLTLIAVPNCPAFTCVTQVVDLRVLGPRMGMPLTKSAAMIVLGTTGYDLVLYRPSRGIMSTLLLADGHVTRHDQATSRTGLARRERFKKDPLYRSDRKSP